MECAKPVLAFTLNVSNVTSMKLYLNVRYAVTGTPWNQRLNPVSNVLKKLKIAENALSTNQVENFGAIYVKTFSL